MSGRIERWLSGEWMLKGRANGGSLVLLRTAWIALPTFLIAIGMVERLRPDSSWQFDHTRLATAVGAHLPWLGAIFAGVYAGLYTRFASQWQYLASLYNQIMAAQAQAPLDDNKERARVYANWMAGFVEDAEDLHLALKPAYAAVIRSMLTDPRVRNAFIANTKDGVSRVVALESGIADVLHVVTRPLPGSPMVITQTSGGSSSGVESLDTEAREGP